MKKILSFVLVIAMLVVPMAFVSADTIAVGSRGLQIIADEAANGVVTVSTSFKAGTTGMTATADKITSWNIALNFDPSVMLPCDKEGNNVLETSIPSNTWKFDSIKYDTGEVDGDDNPIYDFDPAYNLVKLYYEPATFYAATNPLTYYSLKAFFTLGTDETNTRFSFGLGTSTSSSYANVSANGSRDLGKCYFKLATGKNLSDAKLSYPATAAQEIQIVKGDASFYHPQANPTMFALQINSLAPASTEITNYDALGVYGPVAYDAVEATAKALLPAYLQFNAVNAASVTWNAGTHKAPTTAEAGYFEFTAVPTLLSGFVDANSSAVAPVVRIARNIVPVTPPVTPTTPVGITGGAADDLAAATEVNYGGTIADLGQDSAKEVGIHIAGPNGNLRFPAAIDNAGVNVAYNGTNLAGKNGKFLVKFVGFGTLRAGNYVFTPYAQLGAAAAPADLDATKAETYTVK